MMHQDFDERKALDPLPVSLIVPVLNEQETIGRLLRSIAAQTRTPHEVIVVDGGSTDATVQLVRSAAAEHERVRLIEAGRATPGRGRNLGIAAALNDWIALTDGGIELDPRWLERLWRVASSDARPDVVYGAFQPRQETWFERIATLAYVQPLAQTQAGPARTGSIASSLLQRRAWKRAGQFPDLRAAEDRIFMRRLAETGARIAYAPEARVSWNVAPTAGQTFARFRSYSKHNVLAGEEQNWHYGVARQWAAGAAVVSLSALFRRPKLARLALIGAAARTVKTVACRREGRSWWWVFQPLRLVGVAGVLGLLDLATFVGWIEAVLEQRSKTGAR